jgi:hypothetical protein
VPQSLDLAWHDTNDEIHDSDTHSVHARHLPERIDVGRVRGRVAERDRQRVLTV